MRNTVTTLLDTVGLLAVATGVAAGSAPWIGGWSIAVGGAIVMTVSWWWGRNRGGES